MNGLGTNRSLTAARASASDKLPWEYLLEVSITAPREVESPNSLGYSNRRANRKSPTEEFYAARAKKPPHAHPSHPWLIHHAEVTVHRPPGTGSFFASLIVALRPRAEADKCACPLAASLPSPGTRGDKP